MSRRDLFHDVVRQALENDGWQITHDPLRFDVGDYKVAIDLGAESTIAAERNNQKIAVEIKSFASDSTISEFHMAIGQFITYRFTLRLSEPDRELYLAIPSTTYQDFFQRPLVQEIWKEQSLKLLIYNTQPPSINQWVN